MISDIIERLSPLEKRVLPVLKDNMPLNEIEAKSKLSETEVLRALQWLENKKLISIDTTHKEIAEIESNGIAYAEKGLPERQFLNSLKDKPIALKEIREKTKLSQEEITASLGIL